MNEPPPGSVRTPTPLAAALIAPSVLPLPSGFRDRWSDEYRAEIIDLSRTRQIGEAASALSGFFALRSALTADPEDSPVITTSWSCRVGRHRYQRSERGQPNEDNPENSRSQHHECVNGGKIKDAPTADFPRTDRSFMGGGGIVN